MTRLIRNTAALTLLAGLAACQAAPPLAPASSAGVYRALGTEPFWALTITPREMIFEEPNGPTRLVEPTPRPIIGIAGEIYQAGRIRVNIVHARCSDGMSDRIYPDKVQLGVGGASYQGCGGEAVAPTALAGTHWRVAAINQIATPLGEGYFMTFEGPKLSARFGCNAIGGDYRVEGDVLTSSGTVMTEMACPGPLWDFEAKGSAVLLQPMRMSWSGGDRLTLSNGAGSIELARAY